MCPLLRLVVVTKNPFEGALPMSSDSYQLVDLAVVVLVSAAQASMSCPWAGLASGVPLLLDGAIVALVLAAVVQDYPIDR